jgi:hypothetical protein
MSNSRNHDKQERDERLKVAALIGWQIYGCDAATHIELTQWEKCVDWAKNDKRLKTKPAVPKQICIPYEQYLRNCKL